MGWTSRFFTPFFTAWSKASFTSSGLEVECQINGLGEIKAVRDLLVDHAKAAVNLADTGIVSQDVMGIGRGAMTHKADGGFIIFDSVLGRVHHSQSYLGEILML